MHHLNRSIGLTQAVAMLIASLIVGLGVSAIQLAAIFSEHRNEAEIRCQEILTLAEGGATRAAWTLDPRLALDVVSSITNIHGVQKATLRDDSETILASYSAPALKASPLARWFASLFLREGPNATLELNVDVVDEQRKVGTLYVALAPEHVARGFVALAEQAVLASVVTALLVGLILLVLSARLVTSPLRRVARRIAELDTDHPEDLQLTLPARHRHNELGELIRRTNDMLGRLASNQEQLRRLATRDSLTDLPNRELISERLRTAIARARRNDTRLGVLFLDLDRFKTINDSLGHDAGDKLLVQVAKVLSQQVRENDSVGRLGGDEFVVLLEEFEDTHATINSVSRIVNALSRPLRIGNREVRSSASVGIALFPDDGEDATTLMRHADLAMYKAKNAGGGGWQFFAPEMSERVDVRLRTEQALAAALERDEFELAYQAKVHAKSGTLEGCEALLRWNHNGRRVDAEGFIDVAEDTGLVLDLGRWVLDRVCAQISDWDAMGFHIEVAVNVSARQLVEADFADAVLDTVAQHNINPAQLCLEITETALMSDPEHSAGFLRSLTERGIQISIDDFGTGYASLSYLHRLPVQALKIDRSFVSGEQRSRTILETIIAMSRALGLKTIAEGIETEEDKATLTEIGCDVLQGFGIGRPLKARDFEASHLFTQSMGSEQLSQ